MERADDALNTLDAKISLQELRLRQLTKGIAETEQRINDLKNDPIHNQVQQDLEASTSRLATFNEMFGQAWDKAQTLDKNYRDQCLKTVNTYNDALNAFARAQRNMNMDRDRRKQAGEMIQQVHGDLMRLWNKDAEYYEYTATIVSALETVDVMPNAVSELVATFNDQAALARTSASKEAAQAGVTATENTAAPASTTPSDTDATPATESTDTPEATEPMQ